MKSLRGQLEKTQSAYIKVMMERNFLRRATAELNFHNNAHDGIVYTDEADNVIYANPYFLQMMKVEEATDIIGKPLPDYMWLSADDYTHLRRDVEANGFVRERSLNLHNKHKEPIFVACSSVASRDDEDKFIGMEIMLCNVTTKHKLQQQLVTQTGHMDQMTEKLRARLTEMKRLIEESADREALKSVVAQMETELIR